MKAIEKFGARTNPVYRSLREWIETLDVQGDLHVNEQPVCVRNDIAYVSKQNADVGGPAVLHTNINDYPGWRIFHDGLLTAERRAQVLGRPLSEYNQFLFEVVAEGHREAPEVVEDGPCKEVVLRGEDIDLTALPIPTTSAYENPPYITAGISHVITPDGRWQNNAIRRYQLQGERDLTVLAMIGAQHEGQVINEYFRTGRPAPVAVVVGADPLYYLSSQLPAPDNVAEHEYWGALCGEKLRMVRCEIHPQILVPAQAEIVIEGYYHPEERMLEGPFSEFPGFHSGMFYLPRLEVQAVTMRRDPIYQYLYMGREPTEGHYIDHMMYSASMYSQIKSLVPELKDVAVLGAAGFTTAVSIDRTRKYPGFVRQLATSIRGLRCGKMIKNLIVLDDDLDVRNLNDILWAFCSRFQGSLDLMVIDGLPGSYLDPSEHALDDGPGITSFTLFDLTEPLAPRNEGYKRGLAVPQRTARAVKILEAMGIRT